MTATQVLFLFLKSECTVLEKKFFLYRIITDCGNKYFRKRKLYSPTFVEDYLARNNRCLANFMTRLFILAPNLTKEKHQNPRLYLIAKEYNKRNAGKTVLRINKYDGTPYRISCIYNMNKNGMYVNYYRHKWCKFLSKHIISDKKFLSPFKKGEHYEFKYIEKK
jgi:hypothetical protein